MADRIKLAEEWLLRPENNIGQELKHREYLKGEPICGNSRPARSGGAGIEAATAGDAQAADSDRYKCREPRGPARAEISTPAKAC